MIVLQEHCRIWDTKSVTELWGNVLKRNGIPPAPERDQDTTWATFIKNHQDVIAACDFFTAEMR